MQRLVALLLALSLGACSNGGSAVTSLPSTTSSSSPISTTSTTTTTTTGPPTTTGDGADGPTLAPYLAAIERGVDGTGLEGAAFEEPQALVETGILFCGLLDEGVTPVGVLRGWVAALSADGAALDEDELLLGGVVLGAAVRFLCPEHADSLEL